MSDEPAENPRRLRPFFGRTPVLNRGHRRLLLLASTGLFFETYDLGLINAALPQISSELGMPAGDTGFHLSAIRFGGLGSFLLLPFADRIGRRRLFLLALIGMSAGTLLTGLTFTPWQFTIVQMITRAFLLTAAGLALVMVVEEFPAAQRGAGLGLLTILGGLGYGLSAALYAAIDVLPYGWRMLYAFGIAPVVLLPLMSRGLAETRRFTQVEEDRAGAERWLVRMAAMARNHPRRLVAVGAAGFFSAMAGIALFQYTSYFVQEMHGWGPADYSLLVLGGGLIGVTGNVLGGRGSDRWGRRRVGVVCLVVAPLMTAVFFMGPAEALVVAWGGFVFFASAGDLIIKALAAELFPTEQRGTATGWLVGVQTLGMSTGLAIVGFGVQEPSDLGPTVSVIALVSVIAAACLLAVPETQARELEEINAERPAAREATR